MLSRTQPRHLFLFLAIAMISGTMLFIQRSKVTTIVLEEWRPPKVCPPDEECCCQVERQVAAAGGWRYDTNVISSSHVRFDDGLGREIVRILQTNTKPKPDIITVGDIGAGVGQFGRWLKSQSNVSDLKWTGFDGGENVQDFCGKSVNLIDEKNFIVPNVCNLDASQPINPLHVGGPWDWVISIEVGEHVPKAGSKQFLENLIQLCKTGLIVSWAIEGQGGRFHINEANNTEVVQSFEKLGMFYDPEESMLLRSRIDRLGWLRNTVMVFYKKPPVLLWTDEHV